MAMGNGDIRDIALDFSEDLDGNGIPDECVTCFGDLDIDGEVGVNDILLAISIEWGCTDSCLGDLDDSGEVDATDLLIMIALWGPCGG